MLCKPTDLSSFLPERRAASGGTRTHDTRSLDVCFIQWNLSNPDTTGPEESVLIREVFLFQGLKSTQTWYLGRKNVSCLERCPHFRGVLIEGFHCICGICNEGAELHVDGWRQFLGKHARASPLTSV